MYSLYLLSILQMSDSASEESDLDYEEATDSSYATTETSSVSAQHPFSDQPNPVIKTEIGKTRSPPNILISAAKDESPIAGQPQPVRKPEIRKIDVSPKLSDNVLRPLALQRQSTKRTEIKKINGSKKKEIKKADGSVKKVGLEKTDGSPVKKVEVKKTDGPPVKKAVLKKTDGSPVKKVEVKKTDGPPVKKAVLKKTDGSPVKKAELKKTDGSPVKKTGLKKMDGSPARKAELKKTDGSPVKKAELKKTDGSPVKKEELKKTDGSPVKKAELKKTDGSPAKKTEIKKTDGRPKLLTIPKHPSSSQRQPAKKSEMTKIDGLTPQSSGQTQLAKKKLIKKAKGPPKLSTSTKHRPSDQPQPASRRKKRMMVGSPKDENCGGKICPVVFVVIFAAAALPSIIGYFVISNFNHEVALIKSKLTTSTNTVSNFTRLFMKYQDIVRFDKLINQYSDEINRTNLDTLKLRTNLFAKFPQIDNTLNNAKKKIIMNNQMISTFSNETFGFGDVKKLFVDLSREAGHVFYSCAEIFKLSPTSPSGYYVIRSFNGSVSETYCDMTRSCGGITGGWMRVYDLDMADSTNYCPDNFTVLTNIKPRITTCIPVALAPPDMACTTLARLTDNFMYSKVCGRVRGYQIGYTDAFGINTISNVESIDSYYVDGVSITNGNSPRKHIWTFAAAINDGQTIPRQKCACTNTLISSVVPLPPPYVGNDYFCDTAGSNFDPKTLFYSANPLWDGAGCGQQSTCCSFNNPPWFYKQLPQPTTDGIEVRVCRNEDGLEENIAIGSVEIYVQ